MCFNHSTPIELAIRINQTEFLGLTTQTIYRPLITKQLNNQISINQTIQIYYSTGSGFAYFTIEII
jgi:hypothetical protein